MKSRGMAKLKGWREIEGIDLLCYRFGDFGMTVAQARGP